MENNEMSCIDCAVKACQKGDASKYPPFCKTAGLPEGALADALQCYEEEENNTVMINAANIAVEFRGKFTRVEETMEFAKRIGAKKIGIATCMMLLEESKVFAKMLRAQGFEVVGIGCKIGSVKKSQIGLDPSTEKVGGAMVCNPILQAKQLNEANTDLNVAIGLCVGHDSLFYKYSDALVTTLVAKDRVTGHNPCAVLYTANTLYSHLLKPAQK